ncbi:MAG: hypothetical protein LUD74_03725 [Tannerellaceae bacterium]|nr:hypothetical protein [Tannerellaceae bacterium]
MRRVASHYIYWNRLHRMHVLELTGTGTITALFPLTAEIAGTEFYDGLLFPFPQDAGEATPGLFFTDRARWRTLVDSITPQTPVYLYRVSGSTLPPAELCANNCCCDGHIERL